MSWYLREGSPEWYDAHWDKWLPKTQRHAENPHAYKVRMARKCSGLVLDAGCGCGALSRFIKNGVFLDFSRIGLKKRWVGAKRARVMASVENMPFRNGVFTSVFSADVIEHTDNPQSFARETDRVLKNGGLFTFSFPCADNTSSHKFKRITKNMIDKWINPPFSKYELLRADFKPQPRAIVYAYKK